MSTELFGNRVAGRVPCWHRLGVVLPEGATAAEAFASIGQDLRIDLQPAYTEIVSGEERHHIELPGKQIIVRHPTSDDPRYRAFGVVGHEYNLITPADVCEVLDSAIGKPIETMGLLRNGETFFATIRLPEIGVRGDEVERYLGIVSPLDGVRALSAEDWPLRVECQNSLRLAQIFAKVTYRVRHDEKAKVRMAAWLKEAYDRAEGNAALLREVFDLLASKRTTDEQARAVFRYAYPDPKPPAHNAPGLVVSQRQARTESSRKQQEIRRSSAFGLFSGAGVGMSSPATSGTLWGVFNAVAEERDHRRGRGVNAAIAVAGDALFGDGARAKERAFEACFALANGKEKVGDYALN